MFRRIIIIVMDSVGIGALPDAPEYGDQNVNTLANIARSLGGLFLPTMEDMGLGLIHPIAGIGTPAKPKAFYGKMAEISKGKDTTVGHWELAGCPVFRPFPVYPDGFPPEIIEKFKKLTGRDILGNRAASGTQIIGDLGERHMETGFPIVYTSADSVFQIAAHEEVVKLEELYTMARTAREKILVGEHAVSRVITRPFLGRPGAFVRTANRRDFSLEPLAATVLDLMKENGFDVVGVGKICDIFAGRGLTRSIPAKSNEDGINTVINLVNADKLQGLIFANLVDFDSKYGHRNDIGGYAQALRQLDQRLPALISALSPEDLLILTADHGCDPTVPGTDHTREYVPILVYYHGCVGGNLGIRTTFADVAATVSENFALARSPYGCSFLPEILR